MQARETIESFFKRGRLLTPEALKYLENKNAEGFLADNYDLVVDVEDLMAREDKIRIIMNITSKKQEISTADVLKFYNSKYEKMKSIILSRLQKNFVSINRLDTYRNEVFVIGIVREIRDNDGKKNLELEDSTGVVTAIFEPQETEEVELDDVVAIQGVSAGKILYGKKIIYPDTPLRQPIKASGKACFISDLKLDEAPKKDMERFLRWLEGQDVTYLFVAGDIGDMEAFEQLMENYCRNKKVFVTAGNSTDLPALPTNFLARNIISLSNPAMVEINGLKILLMNGFETKMLKKRHLGSIKPVLDEDVMALEELPDIVLSGWGLEASVTNYKATTVICPGSLMTDFRPVIIDMASRDSTQINIDELPI